MLKTSMPPEAEAVDNAYFGPVAEVDGAPPLGLLKRPGRSPVASRAIAPSPGATMAYWPFALLGLVTVAALAVQFALPLANLPRHVSWNNNEGWNAYWSARALAGAPIYTDAASPISDNYPPLSFYIVGYLGRLIGDPILAGRILSLISLLGVTAMIGRAVARFGGAILWRVAAMALFLSIIAAIAQRYLAADDPQWLAEVPMVASLLLLLGRSDAMPGNGRLAAASALMLLSGLIKHNQIGLPIATFLWLAIYDRRGLAVWFVSSVVVGAAVLTAVATIYGQLFFTEVLHHQRIIDHHLFGGAALQASLLIPQVLLAVALARSRPRDRRITLLLLFTMLAIPIGLVEQLGAGVSVNVQFDSAIAIAILSGIALARGSLAKETRYGRPALLAAALAPPVLLVAINAPQSIREALAVRQTQAEWQQAIALVASRPGPVACERPALCYWSGKPYALDVFNYGQKVRKGYDPINLRQLIANEAFGAFVEVRSKHYRVSNGRLPTDYYDLLETHYRVAQILPDRIYVLVPRA